jgi:hypothetical protein
MCSMNYKSALLFTLWLAVVALACNLTGGTQAPPTIAPRSTPTPPPTIGYATLSPEELPLAASTSVANAAAISLTNLANEVASDRLMLHVDSLVRFGTRHVNSAQNRTDWGIGAAANYIKNEFEKIRADSQGRLVVFEQPFESNWAGQSSQVNNIVAFLSGTEEGYGTIVIGAHYDSISENSEDGNALAPGANDNATGVAALIEMARILSSRNHRASIMFVAFAAEEVNRQGSRAFVRDYLLPRGIDINVMINLDIIGSPVDRTGAMDDRTVRIFSDGPNESLSRQAARTVELIALNHVPVMALNIQDSSDREGRYSDHLSFSEAGYPAIRFIQSLENQARQNSSRDTIEQVQAGYFTRVTQTVLTVVTSLADGLPPPRNIALREGGGARTLVWEPIPGASGYVVALRRPNALRYEQFEINEPDTTSITWDGFVPDRFVGLAIAAKDANGMMGPLSVEFEIR